MHIYEEPDDNLYVHHDIMLPTYPLCIAWTNSWRASSQGGALDQSNHDVPLPLADYAARGNTQGKTAVLWQLAHLILPSNCGISTSSMPFSQQLSSEDWLRYARTPRAQQRRAPISGDNRLLCGNRRKRRYHQRKAASRERARKNLNLGQVPTLVLFYPASRLQKYTCC